MAGTVISVISIKGGVGKSTTAINLSAAFARAGRKTLLVDFDPQCNATAGLGVEQNAGDRALSAVFNHDNVELHEASVETYVPNLDLVPGDPTLDQAVRTPVSLSNILAPYLEQLDFCVIDTPPALGPLSLNAIFAALNSPDGMILVPIQLARFSLEGFSKLLTTLEEFAKFQVGRGVESDLFRVLLTMVNPSTTRSRAYALGELEPFREKILRTVIRRNEDLNHAQSYGKAIFDFSLRSNGADDYLALASEILALEDSPDGTQRTSSSEWLVEAPTRLQTHGVGRSPDLPRAGTGSWADRGGETQGDSEEATAPDDFPENLPPQSGPDRPAQAPQGRL